MPQTRIQDPAPFPPTDLRKGNKKRHKKPEFFFSLLFISRNPLYQFKQKDDQESILTAEFKLVSESWTWYLLDALEVLHGKTLSFNSAVKGKAELWLLRATEAVVAQLLRGTQTGVTAHLK